MSLSEARFHDLVDATQQALEDLFDESGLDVDMENSAGVLTIKFDSGSQLIFSRRSRCASFGWPTVPGIPLRLRRRERQVGLREERRAAGRDARAYRLGASRREAGLRRDLNERPASATQAALQ